MLVLACFLVVMAAHHIRRHRLVALLEPSAAVPLPDRLITRAETLAGLDHHDEAIVVALSAAQIAGATTHDPELQRARELLHRPTTPQELRETAERAIARARVLIRRTDC